MTYREFVDWAKEAVRDVGKLFENPDDDWSPIALIEDGNGQLVVAELLMDKADYPTAMSVIIKQSRATKAALVTSAWGLALSSKEEWEAWDADPNALPPSRHPDGYEQVVVSVFDAERVEAWSAKILRDDEQPPSLAEWEFGMEPDGRMIAPIREAMR